MLGYSDFYIVSHLNTVKDRIKSKKDIFLKAYTKYKFFIMAQYRVFFSFWLFLMLFWLIKMSKKLEKKTKFKSAEEGYIE